MTMFRDLCISFSHLKSRCKNKIRRSRELLMGRLLKGRRKSQRRHKKLSEQNGGDTYEGGRKKIKWGRKSFRLPRSSRTVSVKPRASTRAKATSLRRSASHRERTAFMLLLCSFLTWEQKWKAWPLYNLVVDLER